MHPRHDNDVEISPRVLIFGPLNLDFMTEAFGDPSNFLRGLQSTYLIMVETLSESNDLLAKFSDDHPRIQPPRLVS